MAANSQSHVSDYHISIVKDRELDNFIFKKCLNEKCPHESCRGNGFHCPLCPEDSLCKEKPSKIKQHFSTVHVDKRVTDHGGINILRCKLNCQFSSQRVSKAFSKCQPHYHCYVCKNGFPREKEIARHIKTAHHLEKTRLPDNLGNRKKTTVKESTQPTPQSEDVASTSQYISESKTEEIQNDITHESTELPLNPVAHDEDANRLEEMQDMYIKDDKKEYMQINFHSVFKSNEELELKVRKSTQSKIACPSCKKLFHPNSLSQHVRSQHLSSPSNVISAQRHLRSVCVDANNGIYLVRKSFSGGDYVIHVQFKTSVPQCFSCSSSYCKELCETAARSGDTSFLCSHLKSVNFSETPPTTPDLEEAVLGEMVYKMKWLKPGRINECKALQHEAQEAGVPLIVCFPLLTTGSTRYRHFSVFLGDKQAKPWSHLNRVVVTCDTETLFFNSKCCGAGFCVHRNVSKWFIKQLEPFLLDRPSEDPALTVEVASATPKASKTLLYPPVDQDIAKQMVKYIYQVKGIPPELPLQLTVHYDNFKKR